LTIAAARADCRPACAVNLALGLANLPAKPSVGILDLDIFGPSVPKLMGLEDMGEPFLTPGTSLR